MKSNINSCSKCCETIDDRNNKALAGIIAAELVNKKMSIEELSEYLDTLPSFLSIFGSDKIDINKASESLATKIIQGHHNGEELGYIESLVIRTVSFDVILQAIKDIRASEKVPNIQSSRCVIS